MATNGQTLEDLIKARQKTGQVYLSSAIGLAMNKSTANLDRPSDARRDWQDAKRAVTGSDGRDSKG